MMKSINNQTVLVLSALLFFVTSCHSGTSNQKQAGGPVKVKVHTVSENSMKSEREYVGVVEEASNVALSFPSPGKIKRCMFLLDSMYVKDRCWLVPIRKLWKICTLLRWQCSNKQKMPGTG